MWERTNEVVRDLHRALLTTDDSAGSPNDMIPRDASDPVLRGSRPLLYPDIGTASSLAKPGGFRRAFIADALPPGTSPTAYASRPLLAHIGGISNLLGDVVVTLPDGTKLRYRSRPYRLGGAPEILRDPSHLFDKVGEAAPLSFVQRWLPLSGGPAMLEYWSAVLFLVGALLFTEGSIAWMLPQLGATDLGAPVWLSAATVAYPFFIGSICFTAGAYLALVAVINANLSEEMRRMGSHSSLASLALDSPSAVAPHQISSNSHLSTHSQMMISAKQPAPHPAPYTLHPVPRSASHPAPCTPHPEAASPPTRALGDDAFGDENGNEFGPIPLYGDGDEDGEANQQEAVLLSSLAGESKLIVRWWDWQPRSLLYWAVLVQFLSTLLFNVSCTACLPEFSALTAGPYHEVVEMVAAWTCSLLGSLGFVFASYSYLVDLLQSWNTCVGPQQAGVPPLGYWVCTLNLVGSLLFTVASVCYFIRAGPETDLEETRRLGERRTSLYDEHEPRDEPTLWPWPIAAEGRPLWDFEISEWGLRFCFAVGSAMFAVSAATAIVEIRQNLGLDRRKGAEPKG